MKGNELTRVLVMSMSIFSFSSSKWFVETFGCNCDNNQRFWSRNTRVFHTPSLFLRYEKCSNSQFFLVRIFLYLRLLNWIFWPSKSGACYITGQWGRVRNKPNSNPNLNLILFFIIKFVFSSWFLRLGFYEEEMSVRQYDLDWIQRFTE